MGSDDLGKSRCNRTRRVHRALYKHGGIIVVEEKARGRPGCREPDCTVNGARLLKPKTDSDFDRL